MCFELELSILFELLLKHFMLVPCLSAFEAEKCTEHHTEWGICLPRLEKHFSGTPLLLVASLLQVVRPGAPSSFLLLVAMPFVTSSF